MEEAPNALAPEDIVLIASVTAKVHANLKQLRKGCSTPEEFGEKGLTQLIHKDRLMAFSILFNISEIDPNKFYKPEDLVVMVLKKMQFHKDEDYSSWDNLSYEVSAKDMHRTLKKLEKMIGLKRLEKRDIWKIAKKYQIKFAGKPSLYQFPNDLTELRRIYSNPILAELIIKALMKLGFVDDLSFLLEGVIHSLLSNYQEKRRETVNKVFDIVTSTYPLSSSDTDNLSISDLNPFRDYLSTIAKGDLHEFVKLAVHRGIETPLIYMPILILLLPKNEEYNAN